MRGGGGGSGMGGGGGGGGGGGEREMMERESWKLHVFEIQMCSEALYLPYVSKALRRLMC